MPTDQGALRRPRQKMLRHCWRAILLTIVLAGFLVGAARLVLPTLGERLRPQLQTWLSERLDMPVEISSLSLAWVGTGPALRLDGLRVPGASGSPGAFALGRIVARVDLASSVRRGQLQLGWLRFQGTRIILERGDDGVLRLQGRQSPGSEDVRLRPQTVAAWLGRLPRAQLVDGELTVLDPALPGGRVVLREIAASVASGPDRMRFGLRMRLPQHYSEVLELVLTSTGGDPNAPWGWPFSAYLELQGIEPTAIASLMNWSLPAQAPADLRLWAQFASGKLLSASGEAALADVGSDLRLRFSTQASESFWRVQADQIGPEHPGGTSPTGAVLAEVSLLDEKLSALRLVGRDVSLDSMSKIASRLPLSNGTSSLLSGLHPSGMARRIELGWSAEAGDSTEQTSLLAWRNEKLHNVDKPNER